jgi:hypothetical protein
LILTGDGSLREASEVREDEVFELLLVAEQPGIGLKRRRRWTGG